MDKRINNKPPYQLGKKWPNRKRPVKGSIKRVPITDETRKKISTTLKGKYGGSEHYLWKGEGVGYFALHSWVARWKGKPRRCEMCGKEVSKSKDIHWANIDHTYRRVLEDYIRLCRSCHDKYDLENKLRK